MTYQIPKISAAIITLNEERNIVPCIESLQWVDEVVVVDSLSTDNTKDIATRMGAIVHDQKFLGHVKQKQLAVDHCKNRWVLCLDADERVSDLLRDSIMQIFGSEDENELLNGYTVGRRSFHLGRWIMHGGWYPDRKIRLFQKAHGKWDGVDPHDVIKVDGKYGNLKGDLDHYVFEDLKHNVNTNNFYSSISADIFFKEGVPFSFMKMMFKPLGKFIETYVIKRGFLDGLPGLIISFGAAYSMFLKYAKLWELQQQNKEI